MWLGGMAPNFSGWWNSRQYGCQLFFPRPRWRDNSNTQRNLQRRTTGSPDVLTGASRSMKECTSPIAIMQEWMRRAASLVTPSDVPP